MVERQYLEKKPDPDTSCKIHHVYADKELLASELADELARQIRMTVETKGFCHMVFPGGSSPRAVLRYLREKEVPWRMLHLYPSDERCLPIKDPERNDRLIDELLVPYVPLLEENIHRIPAELGPEEGAFRYSEVLRKIPVFDIVLLGVGADGHTASLFPDHPSISDDRDAVPVTDAPKLPQSRVSIGLRRLQQAHHRHVIVLGREKKNLFLSPQRSSNAPVMKLNARIWYAS